MKSNVHFSTIFGGCFQPINILTTTFCHFKALSDIHEPMASEYTYTEKGFHSLVIILAFNTPRIEGLTVYSHIARTEFH